MSKAPQGQIQHRHPGLLAGLLGGQPGKSPPASMVAQPLTEEEAAAELAARRLADEAAARAQEQEAAAREEARRAREEAKKARQAEKLEEKARRQEARRLAAEEARRLAAARAAAAPTGGAGAGFIGLVGRRLVLALTPKGAAVGVLCAAVLVGGAYYLGRHTRNSFAPALAIMPPTESAPPPVGPAKPAKPVKQPKAKERAAVREAQDNPDLTDLMNVPAARRANLVNTNQPASVDKPKQEAKPATTETLNYLQIESFQVTRYRTSEQLKDDVAAVRKFLAEKGVPSFARKVSSGYMLFSERGILVGADHEAERQAFKKKIQQLGKEYRKSGGLYEFKEPFFVSRSQTQVGQGE